jgi:hypothetical protein
MTIARLPDWRTRLSAVIEAQRRSAIENCGWFIDDCVEAMTGSAIFQAYRGRCQSVPEGLALLASDGFPDVCAFLASCFEEIHPSRARAGDIMAFPNDASGWSLGIMNGERVTVPYLQLGLGTVSRETATRAFRVP